ncbi:MAG: DUF2093 domain-containing protein [Alphaproteobacteria bacterium]|nr:DUF2093 domain-containing protein [Alphaproteobacteria bacterium]
MDEKSFSGKPGGLARLRYDLSDYQVLTPGSFVICAVTGKPIPLEELRYWNPVRQEAYCSAAASTLREEELNPPLANGGAATATEPDAPG